MGQDAAVRFLHGEAQREQSRSVLLEGPTGCGKSSLAWIYAHALLCRRDSGNPCLQSDCVPCTAFGTRDYYDLMVWDGDARNEKAFVDTVLNACRDGPAYGERQIVLIDQAECLSREASNALHRYLEIPPAHTTLILMTGDVAAMPERVTTLFPQFRIGPLSMPARLSLLQRVCEQWGLTAEAAPLERLAWQAGGCPRRLLRDLVAISDGGTVTGDQVQNYYHTHCGQPVLAYFEALIGRRDFAAQCDRLNAWIAPAEEKIATIEACMFGLWRRHELRQAGGITAVDHLEWQERERLAATFMTKAWQRGVSSRLFWQAAINTFRPVVPATEAQLYLKAKELDWLLNSPRETGGTGAIMTGADQGAGVPKILEVLKPHPSTLDNAMQQMHLKRGPAGADGRGQGSIDHLSVKHVRALWEAGSFLIQHYGLCLNARLTLRYELLGITDPTEAGVFLSQLIRQLQALVVGRAGNAEEAPFHRLFVHETDAEGALVTHMVMHIPSSAGDVERWVRTRFMPHQRLAACPPRAVTYRKPTIQPKDRFRLHLRLLQLLTGGLDPEVKVSVKQQHGPAELHRLIDVLKIDRRFQRSIGRRRSAARYGVSEAIGPQARRSALTLDLPFLSAFGQRQWTALTNGWEIDDHAYRQDCRADRRRLEAEMAEAYPNDDERIRSFREEWANMLQTRQLNRPGFSSCHAPTCQMI